MATEVAYVKRLERRLHRALAERDAARGEVDVAPRADTWRFTMWNGICQEHYDCRGGENPDRVLLNDGENDEAYPFKTIRGCKVCRPIPGWRPFKALPDSFNSDNGVCFNTGIDAETVMRAFVMQGFPSNCNKAHPTIKRPPNAEMMISDPDTYQVEVKRWYETQTIPLSKDWKGDYVPPTVVPIWDLMEVQASVDCGDANGFKDELVIDLRNLKERIVDAAQTLIDEGNGKWLEDKTEHWFAKAWFGNNDEKVRQKLGNGKKLIIKPNGQVKEDLVRVLEKHALKMLDEKIERVQKGEVSMPTNPHAWRI